MDPKIFHITFLPFDITLEVPEGMTLWEAAKLGGLPLKTPCGGEGTCGECLVQILEGHYTAKPSASLSKKLVTQGYALACQTQITADLTVLLPRFKELPIKSVVTSDF
ncbi:MAG: 2Fe-2S iron-sulfur cluster binding domain-containing protein, partial [Candidatus Aminicenantes bacterium]|nr:2Fe-2S iron-sulfur cluster binding domain-containing protein [Candidatus Aminicenantes bacterium]